jgi:ligand-binding sensor domain-containing protein
VLKLSAILCAVGVLLSLSGCQQRSNGVGQIIYADGYLHFCSGSGTERLNLANNSLEIYPFPCYMMYLAKNGWLWSVGAHSIRAYHDGAWREIDLPIAGNLGIIDAVESLSETDDGLIWASSAALSTYDPQTGQSTVVIPTIAVPTLTPGPTPEFFDTISMPSVGDIGPVFEAADGALWYNQQFDGIVRWDRTTGQKQLWSKDDGFQGFMPIPQKFLQMPDGSIWVGTLSGVYKLSEPNAKTWQTWKLPGEAYQYDRSQGDYRVLNMITDQAGHVWAVFNRAGVGMWDGTKWNAIGDFGSPAGPMAIYEDSTGTIWIGSLQRGLGKYRDGILTMFSKLNITTFAETPDHRLFGGGSDGLYLYDAQNDQWNPYPPQQ